ncbi:MAG: CoA transferase, partial [Pseudomonadota bacterium]
HHADAVGRLLRRAVCFIDAPRDAILRAIDIAYEQRDGQTEELVDWLETDTDADELQRLVEREDLLDTGAHFYDTFETADGKFVSIGSIEPQFYAELRRRANLEDDPDFDDQLNPEKWGPLKEKLAAVIRTKSRAEWVELMEGSDVCFAPVLSMEEAPSHSHNQAREAFCDLDGVTQPAPAPRYSATPLDPPKRPSPLSRESS